MGAFNLLNVVAPCPQCGNVIKRRFQFKYGQCGQHEYQLTDELKWGGNQRGNFHGGLVVIDACQEECPICDFGEELAVIYVQAAWLVGVGSNKGQFEFSRSYDVIELKLAPLSIFKNPTMEPEL